MKILPIAVLADNYAYLIIDEASKEAGVVDPSEAGPVADAVRREGVKLSAIINTHHHWDHVGGNEELVKEFSGVKVYGHKLDKDRNRADAGRCHSLRRCGPRCRSARRGQCGGRSFRLLLR